MALIHGDFRWLRIDSAEVFSFKLVSLAFVYNVEADTEVLVLALYSAITQYPDYERTQTHYYIFIFFKQECPFSLWLVYPYN